MPLKYHVFENVMVNGAFALVLENIIENGAFAPKEQMLHFPSYFQKYSTLDFKFILNFFQCSLKIEHDVMI